jgi:hypothetical protein
MVMKRITFSAAPKLIAEAEQIAKAKGTTLELEVRPWLHDLGSGRREPLLLDKEPAKAKSTRKKKSR